MKVLFFTSSVEDYLSDSLLHGFRTMLGSDCVDFPKSEILYKGCPEYVLSQVRGKGFTLYTGLLDDIEVDRFNITYKIKSGFFDLIVISDIHRQYGLFLQYKPWLHSRNTIILDGADITRPYPASGFWWRKSYYWFLPSAHKYYLYFKREWTEDTHFNLAASILPSKLRSLLPQSINLRKISFSIPEEKIVSTIPKKTKNFANHMVDPEVASAVEGASTSYAFETEKDYYNDLQQSKFAITTKRAGWDCLRHYEIAANGAVPCFRDLSTKPINCAPHGLTSENTIIYSDVESLMKKISLLSHQEYEAMQQEAIRWAKTQTTKEQAKRVLKELEDFKTDVKVAGK
jgi:hypothetical protein